MATEFEDLGTGDLQTKGYTIGGVRYVLCEATGDQVVQYRNSAIQNTKWKDGKMVGLGNVADGEPKLVASCLYTVKEDGTKDKPVAKSVVSSFPARIQKRLFDDLKKMSGMDDLPDNPTTIREQIKSLQSKLEDMGDDSPKADASPDTSSG